MATVMRGIGWIIITYDAHQKSLHMLWVADHELGNVNQPVVLAVDMWEHAYLLDYAPSEKKSYVKTYLEAIHWETVANTFNKIESEPFTSA